MQEQIEQIRRVYDAFNARDIDAALSAFAPDVTWANAMDGGYVKGHEGIRDYWTRQWSIVSPHVEPVGFHQENQDTVVVDVVQTIRDLAGNLLQNQMHGLKDKTVEHVFQFKNGLVSRFDVTG